MQKQVTHWSSTHFILLEVYNMFSPNVTNDLPTYWGKSHNNQPVYIPEIMHNMHITGFPHIPIYKFPDYSLISSYFSLTND